MGSHLGRIGALDGSKSRLVGADLRNTAAVLQYVGAFAQMVEEVTRRCILRLGIIAESSHPAVARERGCRFEAGCAAVLQLNVIHGAVEAEYKEDDQLFYHAKGAFLFKRMELRKAKDSITLD